MNEVELVNDERRSSGRGQEFGKGLQRGFGGKERTCREGCFAPDCPGRGVWTDWSQWLREIYDDEGRSRVGGPDLGGDFNFRAEFPKSGFSE